MDTLFILKCGFAEIMDLSIPTPGGGGGGGGVLPYMGYTGMCRWIGYGFWPLCPEQGI